MRRLTQKTKQAIIAHAGGSIYRMNAKSADCYAFTLDYYNGKPSWSGGWDWLCHNSDKWEVQVSKQEQYILVLDGNNRIVKQGDKK